MKIYQAKLEDVKQLTDVHIRSWQSAYEGLIPNNVLKNIDPQSRLEMWTNAVREAPSETIVAEIDGVVAGFANFGRYRDNDIEAGEIRAIYLLGKYWGKGIGSALLENSLSVLKKNYGIFMLWVLESNELAIRFYERHGFIKDAVEKIEIVENCVLREIRMSKQNNS